VVETFHALGMVKQMHQGAADTSPSERISIEGAIFQEADLVLAECPQDLEDMVTLYQADPCRIEVVPAGVNTEVFQTVPRAEARTRLGLDRDAWTAVYVGRMVARKGIDNLVKAFALLATEATTPVRLVIVGGETADIDPMETPEILRLAEIAGRLGIRDLVRFTGKQPQADLKHWYSAADVAVTTPWYEPFGMTPLEAMACGTPVIGSRVGGIKFSVVDGETGFLVPPRAPEQLAEAMGRLHGDRALGERMGTAARVRVERHFTWGRVAEAISGHYERLLGFRDLAREATGEGSAPAALPATGRGAKTSGTEGRRAA
jgi:glycosyltransferase involved in cell wall biosynthesis